MDLEFQRQFAVSVLSDYLRGKVWAMQHCWIESIRILTAFMYRSV